MGNFRYFVPTQAVRIRQILHRYEPYEKLCPLGINIDNPAGFEQSLVFDLRSGSHIVAYDQAAEAEPALVFHQDSATLDKIGLRVALASLWVLRRLKSRSLQS